MDTTAQRKHKYIVIMGDIILKGESTTLHVDVQSMLIVIVAN